jgi:hypothetical protein
MERGRLARFHPGGERLLQARPVVGLSSPERAEGARGGPASGARLERRRPGGGGWAAAEVGARAVERGGRGTRRQVAGRRGAARRGAAAPGARRAGGAPDVARERVEQQRLTSRGSAPAPDRRPRARTLRRGAGTSSRRARSVGRATVSPSLARRSSRNRPSRTIASSGRCAAATIRTSMGTGREARGGSLPWSIARRSWPAPPGESSQISSSRRVPPRAARRKPGRSGQRRVKARARRRRARPPRATRGSAAAVDSEVRPGALAPIVQGAGDPLLTGPRLPGGSPAGARARACAAGASASWSVAPPNRPVASSPNGDPRASTVRRTTSATQPPQRSTSPGPIGTRSIRCPLTRVPFLLSRTSQRQRWPWKVIERAGGTRSSSGSGRAALVAAITSSGRRGDRVERELGRDAQQPSASRRPDPAPACRSRSGWFPSGRFFRSDPLPRSESRLAGIRGRCRGGR